MKSSKKHHKFFKIFIHIFVALLLIAFSIVSFWFYQDKLSSKQTKKAVSPTPVVKTTGKPTLASTTSPTLADESTNWQSQSNSEAGFSYKIPPDVVVSSTIPSNFNRLYLVVDVQNLNDLPEQAPLGLGRATAIQDKQALEKGQYGQEIDWVLSQSKKVTKINGINVKEFMVFQRFEVCDVTFERKLMFYKDNYRITFTLYGPKDTIISNSPQFFTMGGQQGCGDDFIWKQSGTIAFYQSLADQTGSTQAQNWYNTFDQIVSTISF